MGEPRFEYGDMVIDSITGVRGVVTAYCDYYGMEQNQYRIEYKSEAGAMECSWISENRLAKVV